jgi:hypothetical protein
LALKLDSLYDISMRYRFLLLLLLIQTQAFASPAEEPKEFNIPILDSTQQLFGMQANTVANRLDLFFADQRADDELARSRLRIQRSYAIRERRVFTSDTQIRINLRLPKLQEKFKFEIKSDEKKKEKAKSGRKSVSDRELAKNQLNKDWQFRADVGLNASIPPKVFTRGRLRKNFTTGDVINRFVEELAWYSDRDWEMNTTLDSDLSLDEELLFRFRNSSDWKVTRKDYKTNHGPSLLQRIDDDSALSYGFNVGTIVLDSVWYVTNYTLAATYRRNLYKQWIYADLTPGLDFPKEWHFRRTPFIAFKIEALFGGI